MSYYFQSRTSFSVLEEEDIFKTILSEWLVLKDLLALDVALCGPQRQQLHAVLRRVPMTQPFLDQVELWWKHQRSVLKWMALRQVFTLRGRWGLNETLWRLLITSSDLHYLPILEEMVYMRFENSRPGFRLEQLALCKKLKRLEMYNLDSHHYRCQTQPPPPPQQRYHYEVLEQEGQELNRSGGQQDRAEQICPNLETLFLQGSDISSELITAFASCQHLIDVEYFHNRYSLIQEQEGLGGDVTRYFDRLRSFSVTANVNQVVYSHFPRQKTFSLTKLCLDNVHRNESNTAALLDFLPRCPHLVDLTLTRCRFNFALVLKAIREEMPHLERLHLNHCRWIREEQEVGDAEAFNPGERLHRLIISTPLPMFDQDLDIVLKLCGQFVRDLRMSFCSRLKPAAYSIIRHRLPYLSALTVEYSEEDGYFTAEHLAEIQRLFVRSPPSLSASQSFSQPAVHVVVNKWQTWLTESMKAKCLDQKTTILDTAAATVDYDDSMSCLGSL